MGITVTGGVTFGSGVNVSTPPPPDYSVLYGSGSYSTVTTNSVLDMGSGAYTVEAWFNSTSSVGQQTIVSFLTGFKLTFLPSQSILRVWGDAGSTYLSTAVLSINVGEWYHVAWVRQSTSLGKLYLNGVLVLTVTSGTIVSSMPTGTDLLIGRYGDGFDNPFRGYISNLRIVKGISVYTSDFTPSTSALPATQGANQYGNPSAAIASGTSLLTCKSSTIIDTSGNSLTITDTGTPLVSTNNPFDYFSVEYLVVAGGGAGGFGYYGGGGGGGGYRTSTNYVAIPGSAITVTVGAGGTISGSVSVNGGNGFDSVFGAVTSIGGGGGASRSASSDGNNGGSGGGASFQDFLGGTATVRQGNNGGNLITGQFGGSGGGAGAAGTGATNGVASPGGIGLASSISGTSTYYAGGGGGGKYDVVSAGGLGGGGAGGRYFPAAAAVAGTANTGGGGGGGGDLVDGANGGSGIVIIRYADSFANASATTGSPTITVTGGYRVYKWTSSGSITF
jgi:hypothetical protein